MLSASRVASLFVIGGLVVAAAWGWTGCSSADPTSARVDDAAAEATGDAPEAAVDAAAADAAPFVMAPHQPWPELLPHSGRLLKPMTLVTIVSQNDELAAPLFAFSDALIKSAWWTTVGGEYGVGAAAASLHVTGPVISTSPDRPALIQYVSDAIGDAGAPAPNGNTLYLVYLPSGLTVANATFDSFHNAYPGTDAGAGDGYAVVSRQAPSAGESQLDLLTTIASHEIIEAATDPGLTSWRIAYPNNSKTPWTSSIWGVLQAGTVENGDLCEGTRTREPPATGFLYQRSWSMANAAAGDAAAGDPCVPARSEPYTNVSATQDWYAGAAGTKVSIPLTGWSTGPTKSWIMQVGLGLSSPSLKGLGLGTGLTMKTSLGNSGIPGCAARQLMNNAETGTLSVDIPAGGKSGDFVVLFLYSFSVSSKCALDPEGDVGHRWPVGVYVP